MPHCPKCGEEVEEDDRFCRSCGASLTHVERSLPYCSSCGAELELGDSFCPNCGAPVKAPVERRVEKPLKMRVFLIVSIAVVAVAVASYAFLVLQKPTIPQIESFTQNLPPGVTVLSKEEYSRQKIDNIFGEWAGKVEKAYDVKYDMGPLLPEKLALKSYRSVLAVEFSVWKEGARQEFHSAYFENRYPFETVFDIGKTRFFYSYSPSEVWYCYTFGEVQVHAQYYLGLTAITVDDVKDLNGAVFQVLRGFPGWNREAEQRITDFVEEAWTQFFKKMSKPSLPPPTP